QLTSSLGIACHDYPIAHRVRYLAREIPCSEIAALDDGRPHRHEESRTGEAQARARGIGRVERLAMELRQERGLERAAHGVRRNKPDAGHAADTPHGRREVGLWLTARLR